MSPSLNFDGKVAWVNERFARCEMRIENLFDIDWNSSETSAGVTGVKSESSSLCVAGQSKKARNSRVI